jgi:hypothetical protein
MKFFIFFLFISPFWGSRLSRELKVRRDRLDLKAQLERKENAEMAAQLAKKGLLDPKANPVEMDHPVI